MTVASRSFVRRSVGVALAVAALIAQTTAGFFAQELIAEAADHDDDQHQDDDAHVHARIQDRKSVV